MVGCNCFILEIGAMMQLTFPLTQHTAIEVLYVCEEHINCVDLPSVLCLLRVGVVAVAGIVDVVVQC